MLFGRAPLRVQPYFGFRGEERLFLTARALRSREPVFESRNFLSDLRTMVRQYASHEVPGVEIEFEYRQDDGASVTRRVATGPEGFAHFDLAFPAPHTRPEFTRWETATLRWNAVAGEHDAGEAEAYILAPGRKAGLAVISDIDDTIVETGITGNVRVIARNWKRVMAQMPHARELVPGARDFYGVLGGGTAAAIAPPPDLAGGELPVQHRPVFYVSSSPWNLFSYLVAFKRQRDLPIGPVMLRDWGFNRATLGSEGHGSHKREAIDRIIDQYPDLRFVLVGDDTQKDLIAFGGVVADLPGRVAAVFIREISLAAASEAELAARSSIEQAGVPFWMGSDYSDAHDLLAQIGLAEDPAVEDIIRAGEVS
ncbi:phosphatase domain-containing protein [Erythrobacter sp. JK5]|uniref:phosphatase domain-containing protein n=1 Tax=Erythrobacter sp. JK5 TaxID=2829500 RepID=UPI001BAC6230|nr:phosphatase domain-containing protein [Erythrobacter sp. JK5]QUL37208.1 DUF2183 domain-containing protein [Erythrobacter sp. JK5]